MDLQLTGRTALVTGASRGIGRAIALGLAREGVKVAVAARRVNLLEELAREIVSQRGAEPLVLEADLYQEGSAEKLAQAAGKGLGRIDILVNAAGGSRPVKSSIAIRPSRRQATSAARNAPQAKKQVAKSIVQFCGARISRATPPKKISITIRMSRVAATTASSRPSRA